MALMFNPDPIPVDVIKVLAAVALDALPEGMTELMVFGVRSLRCSICRQPVAKLKQAAYQKPPQSGR
jgi:hypothetical protein